MAMLNNQRVIGFHETFHGIGWILESENLSRRWKSVVNLASWMWEKNLVPKIHWRIRWHHHEIHVYTNRHVAFPFYQEIHIASSIQQKSGICWSYPNTFEFPSSNMACFLAPFPMTPPQKPTIFKSVAKGPLLTKRSLRFTACADLGETPWETEEPASGLPLFRIFLFLSSLGRLGKKKVVLNGVVHPMDLSLVDMVSF